MKKLVFFLILSTNIFYSSAQKVDVKLKIFNVYNSSLNPKSNNENYSSSKIKAELSGELINNKKIIYRISAGIETDNYSNNSQFNYSKGFITQTTYGNFLSRNVALGFGKNFPNKKLSFQVGSDLTFRLFKQESFTQRIDNLKTGDQQITIQKVKFPSGFETGVLTFINISYGILGPISIGIELTNEIYYQYINSTNEINTSFSENGNLIDKNVQKDKVRSNEIHTSIAMMALTILYRF